MSARVAAKICGIKTPGALAAAARGQAAFVGLVFHPSSPRALTLDQGKALRQAMPREVKAVALVVDAADDLIARIVAEISPDLFQLHGQESVRRVAEIRERTNRPVIKALGVARAEDLAAASAYERVADYLLFDAKPAPGGPAGGAGRSFDWRLLAGRTFAKPWFLSGGLSAGNVAEAVAVSGARLVDVSSGVERPRGEKDEGLVAAFLDTVRGL